MCSSLHGLAADAELDLGAFLYAVRRLPASVIRAERVVMGQAVEVFARNGFRPRRLVGGLGARPAPALVRGRRGDPGRADRLGLGRRRPDPDPGRLSDRVEQGPGALASLAASRRCRLPRWLATACGGGEDDWAQLQEVWGDAFAERLGRIAAHKQAIRVRMLGGTQVGYARVTRRWWEQVTGTMRSQSLRDRPVYFVSSNSHSLANLVTGVARHHEASLVELVETTGAGLPPR